MPHVADWLEKLGLGQYAQRFAENEIDFSILGDLTDQDLEKIGVAPLGHRRKLLREIANLGKTADAARSAPSPPVPPIVAPAVAPPAEAAHSSAACFARVIKSEGALNFSQSPNILLQYARSAIASPAIALTLFCQTCSGSTSSASSAESSVAISDKSGASVAAGGFGCADNQPPFQRRKRGRIHRGRMRRR
jgi:hypothetical protein